MPGVKIQDTCVKLTATAVVELLAANEVVHSRTVDATWFDEWRVSLGTEAELSAVCVQHLKTKARHLYRAELEKDAALREKVNKRRTSLRLGTVSYTFHMVPTTEGEVDPSVAKQITVLSMLKLALDELEELRDFMKEHYGDQPVVKRFFKLKRPNYAELEKAQRKISKSKV